MISTATAHGSSTRKGGGRVTGLAGSKRGEDRPALLSELGSGSIRTLIAAEAIAAWPDEQDSLQIPPSRDYGRPAHRLQNPSNWRPARKEKANSMLQWSKTRFIALLIVLSSLAAASGTWGWQLLTWGW